MTYPHDGILPSNEKEWTLGEYSKMVKWLKSDLQRLHYSIYMIFGKDYNTVSTTIDQELLMLETGGRIECKGSVYENLEAGAAVLHFGWYWIYLPKIGTKVNSREEILLYVNLYIHIYVCREGDGTPLQYSCLANPMDRGAWWAAVHGVARVGHDWATSLSLFTFMHWRRKWQPTPVFLPGESQGWGNLVGCHLWGHTELDMTEAT